jgi:hypothetical protein
MKPRDDIDRRLEVVRELLRERRVVVEPGPHFAERVVARLREPESWMFAWAARRVLPATLALAAALMVAIIATNRVPGRAVPASTVSESQGSSDPLDWLLEGRGELR